MIRRNVRGGMPSPYPRMLFHGLRSAQLLSSVTVSGIMAYFIYYLRLEGYGVPWTFIVLMTVSLLTLMFLTVTIVLYNFTYLSPRFNLILNGSISFLWVLGFGLLSWSVSTSHVLAKQCTKKVWNGAAEASVCRDYKALWGMALIGTVSTLAALALDISTQRQDTRRGEYAMPEDDIHAQKLHDIKSAHVRSAGYDAPEQVHNMEMEGEIDMGYHSRYGADDFGIESVEPTNGSGPLERDMGNHNRFFKSG